MVGPGYAAPTEECRWRFSRSSTVVVAALVIGAIAAVTEMVPVFPIQAALGVSPRLVLQSIASGVLGRQAYSGGAATVLLGVAFHLLISVVAALRLPRCERSPGRIAAPSGARRDRVRDGGVPRDEVRRRSALVAVAYRQSTEWRMFGISLAVHILGFGIPIALTGPLVGRREALDETLMLISAPIGDRRLLTTSSRRRSRSAYARPRPRGS